MREASYATPHVSRGEGQISTWCPSPSFFSVITSVSEIKTPHTVPLAQALACPRLQLSAPWSKGQLAGGDSEQGSAILGLESRVPELVSWKSLTPALVQTPLPQNISSPISPAPKLTFSFGDFRTIQLIQSGHKTKMKMTLSRGQKEQSKVW